MRLERQDNPTPNDVLATHYRQGLAAFERRDFASAIEHLSGIVDSQSLPATLARYYLGQAHLREGLARLRLRNYQSAVEHLAASRTLNPAGQDLASYLASAHAGSGRYDLAAAELERRSDDPDRERHRPIALAHACVRDGRREEAVSILRRAIEQDSAPFEYQLQLGLIHAAAEEYPAAIELFESGLRQAPLHDRLHRSMGLACAALGHRERSLEHLATAQQLRPGDAQTAWLLAAAARAASLAGAAPALEPVMPPAAPLQPKECETPSSTDVRSIHALEKTLLAEPDFVEAFLSLPASDVDPQVFSMLAEVLGQALRDHPEFADLHYHCSRVRQRLGQDEQAIESARRAVTINPRYAQALIQLGQLYAATDRTDEAIARLHQAIDAGGDWPDVHYLLGELYKNKGDRTRARSAYRRALAINGGYGKARRALEELAAV